MGMIVSRLTTKSQTTIPQPVRAALRLNPGDSIVYEIDGDRVIVSRVSPGLREDPFVTFEEWGSDADRRAYANL